MKTITGVRNFIFKDSQLKPMSGKSTITQIKLINNTNNAPIIGILPIIPNMSVLIGVNIMVIRAMMDKKRRTIL